MSLLSRDTNGFSIMLFYFFAILDPVTHLSSSFTYASRRSARVATHRPVTLLASSLTPIAGLWLWLTGQIRTTKGDTSTQLSLDRWFANLIPQGMSPSDGCRRDIQRVSSLITALCTITSDPLTNNLNNSVCLGVCI